ncbi:acyltransferase family protein [Caenimonas terrae]|uniref:Acyltransferase family protein n=1 Tax=Caenimonas terrae TaxID=696074 RepID=A0ABW0NC49_9BURK
MFRNIQLLRAWGAVLVLLHHYRLNYLAMGGANALLKAVMPYGFVGVDIFFAISGFIMMHVIHGRQADPENVRDFLGRRFLRIYGWYLPCMAFGLAIMASYDPGAFADVDLLGSATLTSVVMHRLALPISWSLSYELYFYLAIALGWFFLGRTLKAGLWAALVLLVLWSALVPYREGTLLSFVTTPSILEFLAGALFYVYKDKLAHRPLLALYAVASVVLFWLGVRYQATNEFVRIRTFGAGAFFLLCLFVTLEQTGVLRAGRLASVLGDASYSVYLLHLPFVSLFNGTGLRQHLADAGPLLAEAGFWAFVLAFLALCAGLHYCVEKPLYRGLCRLFGLERMRALPVAVAA